MRDRDYYPAGAYDDPNAPYNQVDPPETEFEMVVSFTLERDCTIVTDEVYYDEYRWELCDDADTWKAYDYDYASIPDMLDELVKYIDKELADLEKFVKARTANQQERERYSMLNKMKMSADGWRIAEQNLETI